MIVFNECLWQIWSYFLLLFWCTINLREFHHFLCTGLCLLFLKFLETVCLEKSKIKANSESDDCFKHFHVSRDSLEKHVCNFQMGINKITLAITKYCLSTPYDKWLKWFLTLFFHSTTNIYDFHKVKKTFFIF